MKILKSTTPTSINTLEILDDGENVALVISGGAAVPRGAIYVNRGALQEALDTQGRIALLDGNLSDMVRLDAHVRGGLAALVAQHDADGMAIEVEAIRALLTPPEEGSRG